MVKISNSIGGNSDGGDITQGGRDVVTRIITPDPRQALNAVRTLRASLDGLDMPSNVRSQADAALVEIAGELRKPDPDKEVITGRLERFIDLLGDADAFAVAGASLIRPIRTIATWLGPIAASFIGGLV